jgi:hypothetical protein
MARLFSLDEANALLPELREILTELAGAMETLEQLEGELTALRRKVRQNGHNLSAEPLSREQSARETIARVVARVEEIGCELKDPRTGLIDFPSRREGRTIYLCWKLDEPAVRFWHPLETGFAGRQPL